MRIGPTCGSASAVILPGVTCNGAVGAMRWSARCRTYEIVAGCWLAAGARFLPNLCADRGIGLVGLAVPMLADAIPTCRRSTRFLDRWKAAVASSPGRSRSCERILLCRGASDRAGFLSMRRDRPGHAPRRAPRRLVVAKQMKSPRAIDASRVDHLVAGRHSRLSGADEVIARCSQV